MVNKQKYSDAVIQQIRDLSHLSIKEIAAQTRLTEKKVIYIKQKYGIYKRWTAQS